MTKNYPIVVYEVPKAEQLETKLWHNGGLTELGRAIIESLREDGLNFLPESGIIEIEARYIEGAESVPGLSRISR